MRRRLNLTMASLVLGTAGCANPGTPKPPSLNIPATVTDLVGERVGDRVKLHWTSPSRTTDGLNLTGPTTVEVCRDLAPISQPNASPNRPGVTAVTVPCSPVLATVGHSGESTALIQLPSNLLAPVGQLQLVAYRVRILNSAGRSASPSVSVLVPSGPAPITIAGFHAAQQKTGVVLEWDKTFSQASPTSGPDEVEVLRTLQTPPLSPTATQDAHPLRLDKNRKSKKPDSSVKAGREGDSASVQLRQSSGFSEFSQNQQRKDTQQRAGMIDENVSQEATYVYIAQRLRKVSVGGSTYEILSEPTAPVVVAIHDVFPPEPPRGLVGIPGMIEHLGDQTEKPAGIDLSWEPNIENDLSGYLVYRIDFEEGKPGTEKPVRLTPTPVPGPSFRDHQVVTGHRYTYMVTAIDHNGNESKYSAPFHSASVGP